jgi:hypothetical protein
MNELDITRITDRLMVMGMLWSRRTEKSIFRNNIEDVASCLKARWPKRYLIFDLSGSTNGYETGALGCQVLRVTWPPKLAVPSLLELIQIAQSIAFWLESPASAPSSPDGTQPPPPIWQQHARMEAAVSSSDHVALVHCQNGRIRSSLVISFYLRLARLFPTANDAFEFFIERRAGGERGWVTVTHKRYLRYFDEIMDRVDAIWFLFLV